MQTTTTERAPSAYANARAAELLPLVEAWKAAEDAYSSANIAPAAAEAERNILAALNHAKRANLILLVDDLTSALSHVDGCAHAAQVERNRLADARQAARDALSVAGYGVYSIYDVDRLIELCCYQRPELEGFLVAWIDYLAGMAE
jgi:hypothetical protein